MWRIILVLQRNLRNMKKCPRVADENMCGGGGNNNNDGAAELPISLNGTGSRGSWNGISLVSCFSQPRVNGVDGAWVSTEFAQISEMNHFVVRDSMRYAILM
ncbi:protochlorophyllide reductase [Hibiscus syriacus]|uniref:Protochlorophyllide reductase n=1 Tax=Hibiscus syriacus TaxID=106335 RepID=A0A6A2WA34_HIBSY|nr:protochlorophyllide reductase [Hibiscus syriacus]